MTIIHEKRLGTSKVYLIEGNNGYILVDTGNKYTAKKFFRWINMLEIKPSEIDLVVITHVHFDHVGNLKEIRDVCNCKIAVHENEKKLLENGILVVPPGTNFLTKIIALLARAFFQGRKNITPVRPDIVIKDSFSLTEFGVEGNIVYTPGHTRGSASVLLETGEAFVGDLAINPLPFGWGPIFPPFAEDVLQLLRSWKRILNTNVNMIYPGHGKAFKPKILKDKLDTYLKKLL